MMASPSGTKDSPGITVVTEWLESNGRKPFPFQLECWNHLLNHQNGLLNAPTGCGKTYALFLGFLAKHIRENPNHWQSSCKGLQWLWITPLRALAKDLQRAMQEVLDGLNLHWEVGLRTGDSGSAEKAKQDRQMPEILITTPESLHVLLSRRGHEKPFQQLKGVVVDEWHELLGTKRGVQTELALSRLRGMERENQTPLLLWGISATIGNMQEAMDVLIPEVFGPRVMVKAEIQKILQINTLYPDTLEKYPWSGHLGIQMLPKIVEVIDQHRSTLLFTNTRAQAEIWYHQLLNHSPELAGQMALHHGAIDKELRNWVEDALHEGILKVVVCTSSLDLGVDFRPVDAVIQIGSPKGIARFIQRAGRSGHQPGEQSNIWFVPTHSLELAEAAALKKAYRLQAMEQREPMMLSFDVLMQYLCTLACGDGFIAEQIFQEVKHTHAYAEMLSAEWEEVLRLLTTGGEALRAYDEFKKLHPTGGRYHMTDKRGILRHRMHIGTIVSDAIMKVRYVQGGYIGTIEEWFISKLKPGEVFLLAGKTLELKSVKDMEALVQNSKSRKAQIPSWMGGRLSFSANLGETFRTQMENAGNDPDSDEMVFLEPLFRLQRELSALPAKEELLIEYLKDKDGYHLLVFPFDGRQIHEALGGLIAWRLAQQLPISFSMAMNDYGFELLSDTELPLDEIDWKPLFSQANLETHLLKSINATEMAGRKFRDIAVISGMVFQGFPGKFKTGKHLQSSSSLLFKVFGEFDPDNLLYRQSFRELLDQQFEESRLRKTLMRIQSQKIVVKRPVQITPLAFPLKVDILRHSLSSEALEDRIKKMQQKLIQ